jgi:hypothetical protein
MQDKVNLYYEGQQGRLALRCCMRLVWGDVNFVISAQRYSDSPQEAQVALLETLGQRYINLSKEAERHQQRALELEAQLGEAIRNAEIFRDENQEFKDVLLEKDERILDLEREVSKQRHEGLALPDRVKEVERHLASAIAAGQVEREAKDEARHRLAEQIETTRLLQIEKKELEERLAERDRQIEEANAYTRNQVVELATLRVRNAELELLPARLVELEEEARLARMDREVMVRQLQKVVVLARVVIDSSEREE